MPVYEVFIIPPKKAASAVLRAFRLNTVSVLLEPKIQP